jgi:acyl transferase domain-containing protein/NADPH:quinone reductase-like Zn-dependent oxidoreductase/acyl carrier protein
VSPSGAQPDGDPERAPAAGSRSSAPHTGDDGGRADAARDAGAAIAIVGIGCRFADARGPAEFWELVRSGRNTVRDVPRHRVELGYDIDYFYDPRPRIPGKISSRKGGFLEHPELFDPAAFGIAPRDALTMEPQQRLMVEVTWDALEDAGIVPESLMGERVAVILGFMAEDYSRERMGVLGEAAVYRGHDVFTVGGMSHAVLSGRIAYLLGVTGPSLTLDTACSSSLIATHLACQSLLRGEAKLAIAGGVNVFLSPEGNIALSRSGMLSMSGACKAFDASADGFVRAEGAGVVVLRPLADALANGDPIHAVIRGSGISTDGRDGGHMMAPGRKGQAQAMRDAYAQAGVSPSEVQYVETHGTGTLIGDPVEIGALADVMGPGRPADRPLRVASVKGNLGHAESASGVAGLIKAALCIRHRTLPAQLHFETPNPAIPWDEIPIRVQSETTGWPCEGPALVGVNSFGISGTNAHVVLESPPALTDRPAPPTDDFAQPRRPTLIPLSGHDWNALHDNVARLHAALDDPAAPDLADLAHTLGRRRAHRSHRLCAVARSNAELRLELEAALEDRPSASVRSGVAPLDRAPRIVLVFPGQGAQWLGMGRTLLRDRPAFAAAIDRIDAAYRAHVDWSLRALIAGEHALDWTRRLDVLQPLLVGFEIALAELWQSWGVRPDRVVGQSMGEIAAAHTAGILALPDVARIACHRGRIVARASGDGAMGVVALAEDAVRAALTERGGAVEIAGTTSPTTTIVSGDRAAVRGLVGELDARGVFARVLDVDFASHCFHMDPLLEPFRQGIAGIRPQAATIPFDSTVDAATKAGEDLDVDYWVRNLRAPVAFDRAVARSLEADGEVFVEVSPHATLGRAIEEIAAARGETVSVVASLLRDRDAEACLATSLAELHVRGVAIDFDALQPRGRVVATPLYAYQRERYWFAERARIDQVRQVHPLLGASSQSSVDPRLHTWDFLLDTDSAGFVADHRVAGRVVAPAALHPELALAAAHAIWPDRDVELDTLDVLRPLSIETATHPTVQLVLRVDREGEGEIRVSSRVHATEAWTLHAVGRLRPASVEDASSSADPRARSEDQPLRPESVLDALERCGVALGPNARALRELAIEEGAPGRARALVARLTLPRSLESEWSAYHAHPVLLENAFQLAGQLAAPEAAVRVRELGGLRLDEPLPSDGWCRVALVGEATTSAAGTRGGTARIDFHDRDGRPVGRIGRVRYEVLPARADTAVGAARDLHAIEWVPLETAAEVDRVVDRWILVSDDTGEAALVSAELQKVSARSLFCEKVEDLPKLVARLERESAEAWGIVLLAWSDRRGDAEAESPARRAFRVGSWAEAIRAHARGARQVWLATRGLHRVVSDDRPAIREARLVAREAEAFARGGELEGCWFFDASSGLDHAERVALAGLLGRAGADRQLAARGPRVRVARLRPIGEERPKSLPPRRARAVRAGERNLRAVHSTRTGIESLALEAAAEPELARGHVLVEVRSAAFSQLDALAALGLERARDPQAPGGAASDFAGVVLAVADDVFDLRPGDAVMGIRAGALARRIAVPVGLVARKPGFLGFDEAASLPLPFLAARVALEVVARLRAGERILVESGAGGIGQALIQVAGALGAEVSATASRADRVALLRREGVRVVGIAGDAEQAGACDRDALPSPDGPAPDARAAPGSARDAYDVIVGSSSGARMHALLEWLAPGGRYVDLCPRARFERPEIGALRLASNRSFSAVDVEATLREEPTLVAALLEATADAAEAGRVRPIPTTVFPLAESARALRFLVQNRHVGRVGIDLSDAGEVLLRSDAETDVWADRGPVFVAGGEASRRRALAEALRGRGARDVFEIAEDAADERPAAPGTPSAQGAGVWIEWRSGRDDVFERLRHRLASRGDAIGIVVDVRAPVSGEPSAPSAWGSRLVVDRLRSSAGDGDPRVVQLSIGESASMERLAELIEATTSAIGPDQVVQIDPAELVARAATDPDPLLEGLSAEEGRADRAIPTRAELLALPPARRRSVLRRFVCDALASVLGLSEEGRRSIDAARPIDAFGLDSLMTMELFMGLGRDLRLEIEAHWFTTGPSLEDVAEVLLEHLEGDGASRSPS